MDRRSVRVANPATAALLIAGLLSMAGCQAMLGLTYLINGTDVPADFPGLVKKKVVVVCRPLSEIDFRNGSPARELATKMSEKLQKNVKGIQIIDQEEVADWTDKHSWDNFSQVGKALKADIVVGVELSSFSVYAGSGLYQGSADAAVKVYDMKTRKTVYNSTLPKSLYPASHAIQMSETNERDFRGAFINVLSDQICRKFYPHDPNADVGLDTQSLQ